MTLSPDCGLSVHGSHDLVSQMYSHEAHLGQDGPGAVLRHQAIRHLCLGQYW